MKEDFLHYIWQYNLYNNSLKLDNNTPVDVLFCGEHNYNSGPDFLNAKIKINDVIWVGNIEIHIKSSDWIKHKHQHDKSYDNIILHVVLHNDSNITRENGDVIPTVILTYSENLYSQYQFLMSSKDWIPCQTFINKVDDFTIIQWKESLLIERLQEKSEIIQDRLQQNKNNWEETFYQTLAFNFGFKVNSTPFEMVAKSLPLKYLSKHKNELSLIEAMLFGQAGLLPENSNDSYVLQLIKDYKHLKNKFQLKPIDGHLWKFSQLRPANFPTIRLAQFAMLIYKSSSLLSKITESSDFSQIKKLFNIDVSDYWKNHYVFNKESIMKDKRFGNNAFQNIIINTITPFFILISNVKNQPEYTDKALKWLLLLKPENNKITRYWKQLGLNVDNAFDSQALIQLKNLYCNKYKCLNCRIGNQVMLHVI
jgi:hypothetical protein